MMAGVSHAPGIQGGSFFPSSSYMLSPHGADTQTSSHSVRNQVMTFEKKSELEGRKYGAEILTIDFHCINCWSFRGRETQ